MTEQPQHQDDRTMTAEEELAEPWTISTARWQHLKGVHQPWIAEISPFQMGQMSQRQRDAYEKKRSAEWQASGQCKVEYRQAVVAAFDAGRFTLTDPQVAEDAKKAVGWELSDRVKADAERRLSLALKMNVPKIEELQVGDRVFAVLGSFYGTISKKSRLSVRVKPEKREPWMRADRDDMKADVPGGIQWQHYNEVKKAVDEGLDPAGIPLCSASRDHPTNVLQPPTCLIPMRRGYCPVHGVRQATHRPQAVQAVA